MIPITLAQANLMITTALETGRAAAMKPLVVVVLDAGGHLKAFQREDETSIGRYQIANGKAFGALGMGMGSRSLAAAAEARPHFVNAINGALGGAVVPVPGGVLVADDSGSIIGAVGVSGDNSDNDEICAVAGIEASGFTPLTG